MVRSAPPPKVSLPDVMTAPLMAASVATLATTASSSVITSMSMTFIDLPGMSQVTSAMPSPSTSSLKFCVMVISSRCGRSVRLAGFVQHAHDAIVALEFQIVVRIVRAFTRRARSDFQQQHLAIGAVHDTVAVVDIRLEAGAVAGLQRDLTAVLDQHALAFEDVDELVLLLVPVAQRSRGTGLEFRQIHTELAQAHRIAERRLVPPGAGMPKRCRIIRRAHARLQCTDVDL